MFGSEAGTGILQKLWESPLWKSVWPCLDRWDDVRLRTASAKSNVQGKYGPHGEIFFFLLKKEPEVVSSNEVFSPFFFSAETFNKCALGGLFPDVGDMWKQGCPKKSELLLGKRRLSWV